MFGQRHITLQGKICRTSHFWTKCMYIKEEFKEFVKTYSIISDEFAFQHVQYVWLTQLLYLQVIHGADKSIPLFY